MYIRMNLFYLRHHYLSIVRSKSFGDEVIAFLLLTFMMASSSPILYSEFETYASTLGAYLGFEERRFELFIFIYFALDLVVRLVFKRPSPNTKHYLLWTNKTKNISWQYLITSLFGLVPFMLLIPQLTLVVKTSEWLGLKQGLVLLGLFTFNHYVRLFLQYSPKRTKAIFFLILAVFLAVALQQMVTLDWILNVFMDVKVAGMLVVSSIIAAFYAVDATLKKREFHQARAGFSLMP